MVFLYSIINSKITRESWLVTPKLELERLLDFVHSKFSRILHSISLCRSFPLGSFRLQYLFHLEKAPAVFNRISVCFQSANVYVCASRSWHLRKSCGRNRENFRNVTDLSCRSAWTWRKQAGGNLSSKNRISFDGGENIRFLDNSSRFLTINWSLVILNYDHYFS